MRKHKKLEDDFCLCFARLNLFLNREMGPHKVKLLTAVEMATLWFPTVVGLFLKPWALNCNWITGMLRKWLQWLVLKEYKIETKRKCWTRHVEIFSRWMWGVPLGHPVVLCKRNRVITELLLHPLTPPSAARTQQPSSNVLTPQLLSNLSSCLWCFP